MKKKCGNVGTLTQERTEEEDGWGAVVSSKLTVTYCVLCKAASMSEEMIPAEV